MTLTEEEQVQWREFCRQRLTDPAMGAPHTLAAFETAVAEALAGVEGAQRALLEEWREHSQGLRQRFDL